MIFWLYVYASAYKSGKGKRCWDVNVTLYVRDSGDIVYSVHTEPQQWLRSTRFFGMKWDKRQFVMSNTQSVEVFLKLFSHVSLFECREYWIIYRGPGFLRIEWFASAPTPPPLLPSPVTHLADWEGSRGRGLWAQSYDQKKARSAINHSILSGFKTGIFHDSGLWPFDRTAQCACVLFLTLGGGGGMKGVANISDCTPNVRNIFNSQLQRDFIGRTYTTTL
jgi:hypothetical protein